MAFGTLYSVCILQSVAAGLAEGVSADDEKAGDIQFVVELSLAVCAVHNGYVIIMIIGLQSVEVPSDQVVFV